MSAETKKVLEMLAAGKISQEDAERLLDKLCGAAPSSDAPGSPANSSSTPGNNAGAQRPRYVRIEVERPGRDDVHVRVPISNMRDGAHWVAFLPTRVAERLSEFGIDFGCVDKMSDEEFRRAIDRINVDVQGRSGKHVRIYTE